MITKNPPRNTATRRTREKVNQTLCSLLRSGGPDIEAARALAELSGVRPTPEEVKNAYDAHLQKGDVVALLSIAEWTKIALPPLSDETIQTAYQKILPIPKRDWGQPEKHQGLEAVKIFKDLVKTPPSSTTLQSAYLTSMRAGIIDEVKNLESLFEEKPAPSTVEQGMTFLFEKGRFSELRALMDQTGYNPSEKLLTQWFETLWGTSTQPNIGSSETARFQKQTNLIPPRATAQTRYDYLLSIGWFTAATALAEYCNIRFENKPEVVKQGCDQALHDCRLEEITLMQRMGHTPKFTDQQIQDAYRLMLSGIEIEYTGVGFSEVTKHWKGKDWLRWLEKLSGKKPLPEVVHEAYQHIIKKDLSEYQKVTDTACMAIGFIKEETGVIPALPTEFLDTIYVPLMETLEFDMVQKLRAACVQGPSHEQVQTWYQKHLRDFQYDHDAKYWVERVRQATGIPPSKQTAEWYFQEIRDAPNWRPPMARGVEILRWLCQITGKTITQNELRELAVAGYRNLEQKKVWDLPRDGIYLAKCIHEQTGAMPSSEQISQWYGHCITKGDFVAAQSIQEWSGIPVDPLTLTKALQRYESKKKHVQKEGGKT